MEKDLANSMIGDSLPTTTSGYCYTFPVYNIEAKKIALVEAREYIRGVKIEAEIDIDKLLGIATEIYNWITKTDTYVTTNPQSSL